jgi:acyl carrier protein
MADIKMKTTGIKAQIREFIVENFLFGVEDLQLEDDDSFLEKGIIDSTGILELIEYLEESFAVSIQDDELVPENLDSLNRVDSFIMRKLSIGKG